MLRQRELASIQYLRGIAAILVVIAHACGQFAGGTINPLLAMLGQGGVDIFFVISGYVMTYTTEMHGYDRATFFRRRIARIVPLYWTATLVTAVLLAFGSGFARHSRFSWTDLAASLFFIPHFSAGEPGNISPLLKLGWTLNYEMFFYLLFGALITCSSTSRTIRLATIFTVILAAGYLAHPQSAPLIFWSRPVVFEFLFGCAIACIDLRGLTAWLPCGAWLAALIAGAFLFCVIGVQDSTLAWRVPLRGLPSVAIVLAAIAIERSEAGFPANRLLHLLGDASYSIYLTHLFAVVGLRVIWERLHLPAGLGLAAPLFPVVAIAVGTTFGCLAWQWVERPVTRAAKRALDTLMPRLVGPAGTAEA
ncbi:MAG TPA: acyltransferase [Rhizomicrobium sp.]|jgi:peptidoglycan/LPS O-acetylase OafA/YrhL